MEPRAYYSTPRPTGNQPLHRAFNWFLVLLALISIWLLVSYFVGYGTVRLDVPAHATVHVNGHLLTSDSFHARTGSYTVEVSSARYQTSRQSVRVSLWPSTYHAPRTERQPQTIVSSTIGANGLYGLPSISDVNWSHDNTWLTGTVGPGSASPIALHYSHDRWQVAYFAAGSYPHSIHNLPSDVAGQITRLEVKYAG